MTVTKKIENKLRKIPEGMTFRYKDLSVLPQEYTAAAKALERLVKNGAIERAGVGIFYKPKETVFGKLRPNEEELLRNYLFENNKRIAYITGLSLYNKFGLTRQVPRTIKIASRDKRIFVSAGNLKGVPVKSYLDVTDKNYYLLEILDVIKDFKRIPDMDKSNGISIISNRINALQPADKLSLIRCAKSYPPRVRALLGALLERNGEAKMAVKLKESLNPLSEYDFGLTKDTLPNSQNWNIT